MGHGLLISECAALASSLLSCTHDKPRHITGEWAACAFKQARRKYIDEDDVSALRLDRALNSCFAVFFLFSLGLFCLVLFAFSVRVVTVLIIIIALKFRLQGKEGDTRQAQ